MCNYLFLILVLLSSCMPQPQAPIPAKSTQQEPATATFFTPTPTPVPTATQKYTPAPIIHQQSALSIKDLAPEFHCLTQGSLQLNYNNFLGDYYICQSSKDQHSFFLWASRQQSVCLYPLFSTETKSLSIGSKICLFLPSKGQIIKLKRDRTGFTNFLINSVIIVRNIVQYYGRPLNRNQSNISVFEQCMEDPTAQQEVCNLFHSTHPYVLYRSSQKYVQQPAVTTKPTVPPTPNPNPISTATPAPTSNYGIWGFQPFTVPNKVISLTTTGNISHAIQQLKDAGGGTLQLAAGTYYTTENILPSNIVISGAGIGKTIIKSNGSEYVFKTNNNGQNFILRNMTIDATGNNNNAVEITYGGDNFLAENLEIFGAKKSNLIVWNPDSPHYISEHITFKNIKSHHARLYHGMSFRYVKWGAIINSEAWDNAGYGIDSSTSDYVDIGFNNIHNNDYGSKYPRSNHTYIHNNIFRNNKTVGIKFNRANFPAGYFHLEDNIIENCVAGAVDWGDDAPLPTFTELVLKNNSFSGNSFNYFRVRASSKTYLFGDIIHQRGDNGSLNIKTFDSTVKPEQESIGYKYW